MQIATSQQDSAQITKLDRALTEAISKRDGISHSKMRRRALETDREARDGSR